ncbi:MAG: hypothetical protein J6A36_02540 [Clostridia bacterium]|nr:hypothetical protein [Clostridia bacterium]
MKEEIVLEHIESLKRLIDIKYGKYLNISAEELLLNGGCFEFAKIMNKIFPQGKICLRNDNKHCAIEIDENLYDVLGRIDDRDYYRQASQSELEWMQDKFGKDYKYLNIADNVCAAVDQAINKKEKDSEGMDR